MVLNRIGVGLEQAVQVVAVPEQLVHGLEQANEHDISG